MTAPDPAVVGLPTAAVHAAADKAGCTREHAERVFEYLWHADATFRYQFEMALANMPPFPEAV